MRNTDDSNRTLSLKNLKKTHSLKNLKKALITENLTKDPITDNLGEISTLKNLKRTLSLRTLRNFRTVNDFGQQKNLFMMIYHRVKRFYTEIFLYFKRALKIQENFLILLITTVISKKRKLHEKKVAQYFRSQKVLIKIE